MITKECRKNKIKLSKVIKQKQSEANKKHNDNKPINNLKIKNGQVILNGNQIDLVWNYDFIKKITSGKEEAILKLEIIIDGNAILENS